MDYHEANISDNDKDLAVAAHLLAFSGLVFPFGHILGPLIMFLLKKDESAFVRRHSLEALNFQISTTLYYIIAVLLTFFCIGLFLILPILVLQFVCTIIAAVRASERREYEYPLTLRLIQ